MTIIAKAQNVYYGPSRNYDIVGSVGNNETVNLRWKEKRDNIDWAYIEYDVDGKPGIKKSGYVPFDQVSDGITSLVFKARRDKRYVRRSCLPFLGRSNIGYASIDGINKGTIVYYTGMKFSHYAFVENENANKRFWIFDNNLSDSVPINKESNSLAMMYNVLQETKWNNLNPRFASHGCAVCCAADVASYLENAEITPDILYNRGVFTATDINCKWHKVYDRCIWDDKRFSGSDYLQCIVQNINSGLPVVIELEGHFIVAYGYNNDGSSSQDILVKDPMGDSYNTLQKAMSRNNHPFKNWRLLYRR